MDHHPTAAELHGFASGRISAQGRRAVVTHLLRGCEACSRELATRLWGLFGPGRLGAAPPPPEEAYSGALERAFAAVRGLDPETLARRSVEQRKEEAIGLLAARGLAGLEAASPDLGGLPLYEALLERSWELRYEDAGQMVELARCAALMADQWSDAERGTRETADLRCRAWVELANAYRVADDLDRADEALERAVEQFVRGTQNEILGARFFMVLAAHYAAHRAFPMACGTLDITVEAYRRLGDRHLAGRALITRGIFTGFEGNAEEAIRWIQEGLASVDGQRDPTLIFSALQSQAWFLAECGRFREARRALFEIRRRRLDTGGRLGELKVRWLEGHIYAGLEEFGRAEQALRQVKAEYETAGLPYKAALAGLELGAVWLRQERIDEATEAVQECTAVFLSLNIKREVMASLLLLRKAAEMRRMTLKLLEHVIASLHEAEKDPTARMAAGG
ncbi:MAG TPA: hypothetical protein VGX68_28445 [Thermoanaerobaculia bacterium]|nr:hypothetical protein [Thermoanaerobaculia bacterium]